MCYKHHCMHAQIILHVPLRTKIDLCEKQNISIIKMSPIALPIEPPCAYNNDDNKTMYKVPTLSLKPLNNTNRSYNYMYIEIE